MSLLTQKQVDALDLIHENKSISKGDRRIHGNTLNSLVENNLIHLARYANGEYWELKM